MLDVKEAMSWTVAFLEFFFCVLSLELYTALQYTTVLYNPKVRSGFTAADGRLSNKWTNYPHSHCVPGYSDSGQRPGHQNVSQWRNWQPHCFPFLLALQSVPEASIMQPQLALLLLKQNVLRYQYNSCIEEGIKHLLCLACFPVNFHFSRSTMFTIFFKNLHRQLELWNICETR